MTKLFKLTPA